jgi:hypothetical protein
VFGDFGFRRCDLQAAGHAQMNDPLTMPHRLSSSVTWTLKVEDDVLTNATHLDDSRVLKHLSDLVR